MKTMKTMSILTAVALIGSGLALAGESVDRTLPASAKVSIEIENVSGSVEVEAWDRSEVRIVAELGDDTEGLSIESEGDEIRIEVEVPEHSGRWGSRDIESTVKVWVPAGASVDVETVSADIEVHGVNGELNLESVSGSIEADGEPATADMSTVSGSIKFSGLRTAVDAETVSGRVTLKGVEGRVDVSTVSGGIKISAGSVERADFESVSGSIEFRGALAIGGRLDASSHSGNVELFLPANTAASFEVETFAGDIRSDFGGESRRTSRYAPGKELYHSTGSDAKISVETFSGNVFLGKSKN
jgi:DUF4097 and DUF4098 domain-containing protein YvlB